MIIELFIYSLLFVFSFFIWLFHKNTGWRFELTEDITMHVVPRRHILYEFLEIFRTIRFRISKKNGVNRREWVKFSISCLQTFKNKS